MQTDSAPPPAATHMAHCTGCACAIPLDEAVVPEAVDYVIYFCGLACFDRWRSALPAASAQCG